jgi:hypothetical protein
MTARLVARCLEPDCGWSYHDMLRDEGAGAAAFAHHIDTHHDWQVTREDDGVAPVTPAPKLPARVTMFGGV